MHLPDVKVLLFGSRTDDTKRGGDIDLLVINPEVVPQATKSLIFLELLKRLGERRIDFLWEREAELSHFAKYVIHQAVLL